MPQLSPVVSCSAASGMAPISTDPSAPARKPGLKTPGCRVIMNSFCHSNQRGDRTAASKTLVAKRLQQFLDAPRFLSGG